MVTIIWYSLTFIFAVMVLITVHEFGHFIVARMLGIKVERFSIGFGKTLWEKVSQSGTHFVIAAIPLGGYVKMLDEAEGPVPEKDLAFAFNRQSLIKRISVVLAGPVFNFALAIICFWLMFFIGVKTVVPIIGEIENNSIAQRAGLPKGEEIVKVNDKVTPNWRAVRLAFMEHIGRKNQIKLSLKKPNDSKVHHVYMDVKDWQIKPKQPRPILSLGINPYIPSLPPIVGSVLQGGIAAKAGIKDGDNIVAVNQETVLSWLHFAKLIRKNPGKQLTITLERDDEEFDLKLTPAMHQLSTGEKIGVIGIQSLPVEFPDEMIRHEKYGPLTALVRASSETWYLSRISLTLIAKLVMGHVSIASLSGPIGIAQGAGQSASIGFIYYLGFLGLISVSLAIINLLPIPVLDGGHLLYYLIEAIRGKPVTEKTREVGLKLGLGFIVFLMVVAIYNDVMRLAG